MTDRQTIEKILCLADDEYEKYADSGQAAIPVEAHEEFVDAVSMLCLDAIPKSEHLRILLKIPLH